jgi:uncharacterized membrane protein YbhN (UPF0104 family)
MTGRSSRAPWLARMNTFLQGAMGNVDGHDPIWEKGNVQKYWIYAKFIFLPCGLGALIWYLSGQQNLSLKDVSWWTILVGIFLNQVAIVFFVMRSQHTLRLFSLEIPFWQAQRIHLQGMFYFFFVPMSVGLDITRLLKVRVILPAARTYNIFLSILLDRLAGLVCAVLVILALAPFIFQNSWFSFIAEMSGPVRFGVVILTAVLLVVAIYGVYLIRKFGLYSRQRLTHVFLILAYGSLMQITFGLAIFAFAQAFGIVVSVENVVFASAASIVAMVIPVSFLGVSAAEVVGMLAFVFIGLSSTDAAMMVAFAYICRLIAAIQGGIWEYVETSVSMLSKSRP